MSSDPHDDHEVSEGSLKGMGHETDELMGNAVRSGSFIVFKAAKDRVESRVA